MDKYQNQEPAVNEHKKTKAPASVRLSGFNLNQDFIFIPLNSKETFLFLDFERNFIRRNSGNSVHCILDRKNFVRSQPWS